MAYDKWKASIIDTKTAAKLLDITPEYAAMLCKRGELDAVQVGREWAVNRRSVEARRARALSKKGGGR